MESGDIVEYQGAPRWQIFYESMKNYPSHLIVGYHYEIESVRDGMIQLRNKRGEFNVVHFNKVN